MAGLVPAIRVRLASEDVDARPQASSDAFDGYGRHDDANAVKSTKAELRREAIARRDALPADARKAAAEAIAARKFPLVIAPGAIVSGFMPLKSEINPLPLMQKLAEAGARLALPAIAGRGKPLIMRAWQLGEPLDRGAMGHSRAEAGRRRRSIPTSYWCRSWRSTAPAIASAMAPAITT